MGELAWWRWAALLFIFILLTGAWVWTNRGTWRKLAGKKFKPRMQVIERKWIGAKSWVVLMEVDGESFLVLQGPTGASWQKLDKNVKEGP